MNKYVLKSLFRSIKSSFGRYFSIFAIVALGIGFFTGLRNAEPSMEKTLDKYYDKLNMYDFNLMSTMGFENENIKTFENIKGVKEVEAGYKSDILATFKEESLVLEVMSIPEIIALPDITKGKMPTKISECLGDDKYFNESDIGKIITFNDENNLSELAKIKECKIVGITKSPRYISIERGDTELGAGKKDAYIYLAKEAFKTDIYHELLLTIDKEDKVSSKAYQKSLNKVRNDVEKTLTKVTTDRYNEVTIPLKDKIKKGEEEIKAGYEAYNKAISSGVPPSMFTSSLEELKKNEELINEAKETLNTLASESYALDLNANIGYVRFNNDIGIVSAVASAFPIFFLAIASLICLTTMTRMVKEERTNIGVMKAIGLSSNTISLKFILYGGSAAFLGTIVGFFIGTGIIPIIIWSVYDMWYGFSPLDFYFSTSMYFICIIVTLLMSYLITLITCKRELKEKPAELIRPKNPGKGKRIFFEYITFFWHHLSFLSKVVMRNTFRYKKRLIMMLLGIGGCTALMVTGFGLKDSIANILDYQYEEIMLYDAYGRVDENNQDEIIKVLKEYDAKYLFGYQESFTLKYNEEQITTNLVTLSSEASLFFNLHNGKEKIPLPKGNEAVVTSKVAKRLKLKINDNLVINNHNYKVIGIADNYFNSYVYIEKQKEYVDNYLFINMESNQKLNDLVIKLRSLDEVNNITIVSSEKDIMADSMTSLNYIIILIVFCAGALALIVLYNLTNISIIERSREIATVKVLGFNSKETGAYILRENLILSVLGSLVGLLLGKLLHAYVISRIDVDFITFDIRISWFSYLLGFILSILFTLLANFIMKFKLEKINMAESLKSFE